MKQPLLAVVPSESVTCTTKVPPSPDGVPVTAPVVADKIQASRHGAEYDPIVAVRRGQALLLTEPESLRYSAARPRCGGTGAGHVIHERNVCERRSECRVH